ncbi:hypothetical protein [Pseudomonas parafulva]|uniref:hypothetical protein n=1 Tax=Pseudomonas parafulva TaxID=157782 RepID=UPI0013C2DBDA|nr:hypothetical protein [Pseudomonas parafulva]
MTQVANTAAPDYLYRFIRSNWLENTQDWLVLRPGPPPEDFISLYVGVGATSQIRVCDAVANCSPRFTLSAEGKAWELDTNAITERINRRKIIVNFIPAGPPHYGMEYKTTIDREIQQANTILIAMSHDKLHSYNHCQSYIDKKAKQAQLKKDSKRKK